MKFIDGIRNGSTLFSQGLRAPNPAMLQGFKMPIANVKGDDGDYVSNTRLRTPTIKPSAPKQVIIIRTKGK